MKHVLTSLLMAVIFITAAPTLAEELSFMHFSGVNEKDWNLEATGHFILIYECVFHNGTFATLHDVVESGFGVTEESAQGFPFPVRYFAEPEDSPAGHYGYVVKEHPSVFIRMIAKDGGEVRWVILAVDPAEDGINGNEILR